ncbi:MAG: DUF5069 domain-containing protein [Armatimonadetes bacterium]|nr:DUF5069 domain-containing protein [Armatimonadota bacterium]
MDLTKNYPRPGELILGGYPWLARAIDKARAYNAGTLGDYIYPCPIDKELLADLNLTGEEFAELVEHSSTDEEALDRLDLPVENPDHEVKKWAREFLENRHDSLVRLAEEEGRVCTPPDGVSIVRPFA